MVAEARQARYSRDFHDGGTCLIVPTSRKGKVCKVGKVGGSEGLGRLERLPFRPHLAVTPQYIFAEQAGPAFASSPFGQALPRAT